MLFERTEHAKHSLIHEDDGNDDKRTNFAKGEFCIVPLSGKPGIRTKIGTN
jgi:hypothetical protein